MWWFSSNQLKAIRAKTEVSQKRRNSASRLQDRSLPECLACLPAGFPSPQNCVSQVLKINLHTHTHPPIDSSSLENTDTKWNLIFGRQTLKCTREEGVFLMIKSILKCTAHTIHTERVVQRKALMQGESQQLVKTHWDAPRGVLSSNSQNQALQAPPEKGVGQL